MMSPTVLVTAASIATVESLAVSSIANPTELNSRVGTIGQKVLCYQIGAASDIATMYAWETANSGGASAPYVMAASGSGFWYAVAGRYANSAASINGAVTCTSLTDSGLTITRIPFAGTGGLLSDADALTYQSGAGLLTVGSASHVGEIDIDGSGNRILGFLTNTAYRWDLRADSTSESGSNAGSNFKLRASDDSGNLIDTPISIVRAASGAITLARPVSASSTLAVTGATTLAATAATTISASGQITSTVSTGTAPLVIASTTKVANLNVDLLDGTDWRAPGAIGGTTPGSGAFTTLSSSGLATLSSASVTTTLVVGTTSTLTGTASALGILKAGTQDGGHYIGIARNASGDHYAYINSGIGGDGVTQASTGLKLAVRNSGNTQVIGLALDENGAATFIGSVTAPGDSTGGLALTGASLLTTTQVSIGSTSTAPTWITGTGNTALRVNATSASGATATNRGINVKPTLEAGAYTCGLVSKVNVDLTSVGASAAVTRTQGVCVRTDTTGATGNAAYVMGATEAVSFSGNWCLYNDTANKNYLGTGATLINTTTDDGVHKLQVTGAILATKDSDYSSNVGGLTTKGVTSANSAVRIGVTSTPVYFIQANLDGTGSRPLSMQPGGGNLLVGTATDDGSHLLQVAGTSAFAGTMTISSGSTFPGNNIAGLYCTSGDGLIITGGAGTTSSMVLLNNLGQNAVTVEHGGSSVLITGGNYATNTVTGFLQIASCAGAPTGTPTGGGLLANAVSLMYDRTNHKLYAYDGSWKSAAFT